VAVIPALAHAQETDITQTPNTANAGIKKSLIDQVGTGRGTNMLPDSSVFIIQRDPARSVVRGRQLFQRKFTRDQGNGPRVLNGVGDIEANPGLGAGMADSCAACHARPKGSAGFGGDVFTRPDSRDAPHLFGLGLQEMLADEITSELRGIRTLAVNRASMSGMPVSMPLSGKGIDYGMIHVDGSGVIDTTDVEGVDSDLRVRPFFAEGSQFSMREFAVGAFAAEMGMPAFDPDLATAAAGGTVTTPSGLVLNGMLDTVGAPPASSPFDDPDADGVIDEVNVALIDHMEFYLLNYFKPGRGFRSAIVNSGAAIFDQIGCQSCHVRDLAIVNDRRVADVETAHDPAKNGFNDMYATAALLLNVVGDMSGFPDLKLPAGNSFLVEDIFTDFKRHDLGSKFWERNFDGSLQKEFVTEPLWGVGSTPPYGHDGRSMTLRDVILRHGGEAETQRNAFEALAERDKILLELFLQSFVLFPPPDTASNLEEAVPGTLDFPQYGHGSINLSVLFNDPLDKE
jgi:cytochrome c2